MVTQTKPSGFACPVCSSFLEVNLKNLLFETSITCPHCLTVFSMDRHESKQTHDLVQKLETAIEDMEAAKKFKAH